MFGIMVDFLTITSILSGLLVITNKNPVLSVIFLIGIFISVSGILCLQGLTFIGLTYLVVYVGAISILFLFVVMILTINYQTVNDVNNIQKNGFPLAFLLGLFFFYELYTKIPFKLNLFNYLNNSTLDPINQLVSSKLILNDKFYSFQSILHIQSIGESLYSNFAVLLIFLSLILLLAIVGPIVLTLKNNKAYN